jgi:hypothetical protein
MMSSNRNMTRRERGGLFLIPVCAFIILGNVTPYALFTPKKASIVIKMSKPESIK